MPRPYSELLDERVTGTVRTPAGDVGLRVRYRFDAHGLCDPSTVRKLDRDGRRGEPAFGFWELKSGIWDRSFRWFAHCQTPGDGVTWRTANRRFCPVFTFKNEEEQYG
jgi:hypothetical protein